MTTISVRTLDESDPAALYRRYPGEEAPQTCFVVLDTESGELSADWNGEVGNARPASVFHGLTLRFRIPVLTATAANRLLAEVAPLAQHVLDDWTVEWDGSNRVGRASTDHGNELVEEIEQACGGEYPRELSWHIEDMVSEYDAGDWYSAGGDTAAELGITATTTDDELATIAATAESEAATALDYGHTVLTGALEYLTGVREELREQN